MARDEDIAMGRKVYVGNLDADTSSTELEDLFHRHGKILSVWVARNPPGFAFVTFEDPRDARDAVESTDGIRHKDKYLRVEVARGPQGGSAGYGRSRRGREAGGDRNGYRDDYSGRTERYAGTNRSGRTRSPRPNNGSEYSAERPEYEFRARSRSRGERRPYSPRRKASSPE